MEAFIQSLFAVVGPVRHVCLIIPGCIASAMLK